LHITKLFKHEVIFLEKKDNENLTPDQYLKQIALVENTYNLPAVLILNQLEAYKRKRLIEKQIAFIVPDKQMFIPQLFIDFKEFRNTVKKRGSKLLPAAQCLLFYHLLKEDLNEINFKTIAGKLNYTPMSITRAVKDLKEKQLCKTSGRKEKAIVFEQKKQGLWQKALPYLQNPIKKKIFTDNFHQVYIKSGINALTFYTNIADEENNCFAISGDDFNKLRKKGKINLLQEGEGKICLEVWKYRPALLAQNIIVDPLSLYMIFKENDDERIQMGIEPLVNRFI
jgi:DNA-binding MarR family transcriptional regulator